MPRYAYRALDAQGELVKGEMESADRASLVEALRSRGYRPLHTEPAQGGGRPGAAGLRKPLFQRRHRGMNAGEVALFTRELATLLAAGLPLDQALSTIAGQAERASMATTTRALQESVRGGSSFSEALASHPGIFPGHYVGLVRAGEAGGTLDKVVAELADSLEHAQAMRHEVRSALNYPILVLVAAGISILVLLFAVIPEFEPLFESAGGELPITAAVVLSLSQGLRSYWWALAIVLLALLPILRALRTSPAMRARLDTWLLRLPAVGQLLHKIEAARFCRTLGTLLENGVDVVPALEMSGRTLANSRLAARIAAVGPRLRRGEGLSEPLTESGVLPELAARLVQTGEASGALGRMLMTVSRIYEGEIGRETRKLVALIVPVVTLLIGLVVFAVIGAILSAILTSYDLPF